MPLYDYECDKCGRYELTQRITEPALAKCERCGSKKFQRLISNASFSLKGGGWYSEGYSSTSNSSGSKKNSAA